MNENTGKRRKEIIIDDNRDFKGVWIPERLYLTREFTANEKFLLIEIYSLTQNKSRQCFASNKHFANFVGIKENTVQKMLLKFENAGYLKRFYEYKENTKEIERRILILTNKFYDKFINEHENFFENDIDESPQGHGFSSTGVVDKNPHISNTYLSNTNEDIEVYTSPVGEDKAYTAKPRKTKKLPVSQKETYEKLKQLEKDMLYRFDDIVDQYDISERSKKNIKRIFRVYLEKYTKKTGLIHPILKDETLEKVFIALATIDDTEYGHFYNVADYETRKDGSGVLDDLVEEHFRTKHKRKTDWHITHFAKDQYLNLLSQRVIEY